LRKRGKKGLASEARPFDDQQVVSAAQLGNEPVEDERLAGAGFSDEQCDPGLLCDPGKQVRVCLLKV
jgi:hypothetical protein